MVHWYRWLSWFIGTGAVVQMVQMVHGTDRSLSAVVATGGSLVQTVQWYTEVYSSLAQWYGWFTGSDS